MLNEKSLLITGGTGSFGKAFIKKIFERYPKVGKIIVYSRDELKQFEMRELFPDRDYPAMEYVIGDVRDAQRLRRACEGLDIVIHAAALKQVPAAEYNPMEAINTNVLGAENVINAALEGDVKKVVALSTDKAAAPINLYGATKLCSDKLFISANNIKKKEHPCFSVVRYGNVMGSRGSVIPFFIKKRSSGTIPITHENMTRFNIVLDEAIDMVFYAIENAWGGELFVPKIPSYSIMELAKAIAPECQTEIIGIRPGEKLHEELITESDSLRTVDCGDYYVILPSTPFWDVDKFMEYFKAKQVPLGFKYNSGENDDWIEHDKIRSLIKAHLDPNFSASLQ